MYGRESEKDRLGIPATELRRREGARCWEEQALGVHAVTLAFGPMIWRRCWRPKWRQKEAVKKAQRDRAQQVQPLRGAPGEKGKQEQHPARSKHSLGHRLLHLSKAEGKAAKLAEEHEKRAKLAQAEESQRTRQQTPQRNVMKRLRCHATM